jgi:hypothetical protein
MTERTTSRVIPRPDANDSIPVLTEVFELPGELPEPQAAEGRDSDLRHPADPDEQALPASGEVADVFDAQAETEAEAGSLAGATEEELRAVRTELLSRVMMRFRAEWPEMVHAQTQAAVADRLAPLARQIANELSRALEARLVEWLDATLEEIERDPGGR